MQKVTKYFNIYNMGQTFLSIDANFNNFSTISSKNISKFLLDNDFNVLSKAYSFLQKNDKILLVTGFLGTGKNNLGRHMTDYLASNVFCYTAECDIAVSLDDILLQILSKYKKTYVNQDNIKHPQYMENIQEKVQYLIEHSPDNIVLTFMNFDQISESNKDSILNFLYTVSQYKNVKIIISSKTFDTSLIPESIPYSKVLLKALNKNNFEKLFQTSGLRYSHQLLDELYKITRGYYFYTDISIKILKQKNLSINDYLVAYANSGMSFDKFLAKAFFSMLSGECQNMLNIFAYFRHPLTTEVLDYFQIYDNKIIEYLCKNKFLKSCEKIYVLNNYYRDTILSEMDENNKNTLSAKIIEFYNNQLTLKPSERLLLISRFTMREEIDYHKKMLGIAPDKKENIQEQKKEEEITAEEILKNAEELIKTYKYNEALILYSKLIEEYNVDKYKIYSLIIDVYEKTGNVKLAFYYTDLLMKYYESTNDTDSIINLKLKIARIYYQAYKVNDAVNVLNDIISSSKNPQILLETYKLLGNIFISTSSKEKAYNVYNKAIQLTKDFGIVTSDTSELYFKFAILSDENEDTKSAIENYKNCIDIADDSNKYKSLAYSNLAEAYLDTGDKALAITNFKKALALDKTNNNFSGIYYTASKIAKLFLSQNEENALDYYIMAKTAAIKTNESFAMASSGLHLGDFYYRNKQYYEALKEYSGIWDIVNTTFNDENKKRVQARIEDTKRKIDNI